MKKIKLPNGSIILILTAEEIEKRAKEKHNFYTDPKKCADWDQYEESYYENCLKQPMPFKLFRLNELSAYDLNNVGVEITEEQYMDRLGELPPLPFKIGEFKGWIVPECITGNRYEHLFKYKGKYYCVIMDRVKNVSHEEKIKEVM